MPELYFEAFESRFCRVLGDETHCYREIENFEGTTAAEACASTSQGDQWTSYLLQFDDGDEIRAVQAWLENGNFHLHQNYI